MWKHFSLEAYKDVSTNMSEWRAFVINHPVLGLFLKFLFYFFNISRFTGLRSDVLPANCQTRGASVDRQAWTKN